MGVVTFFANFLEDDFSHSVGHAKVREAGELLAGEQQALRVMGGERAEGLVTRADLLEALAS